MRKYLNEAYLGLLLGICVGIYFLYTGLTKEKITSDKDLSEIKGTYYKHSFKDNTGFKNFTHQYYIWTAEYPSAFQIKADYLSIFDSTKFSLDLKSGDSIRFSIPTKLKTKLNSTDNIFVTSIKTNKTIYLDQNKILEKEKQSADSSFDYVISIIALISGIFTYFKRR